MLAQAALDALTIAQATERTALIAYQQRELADQQRKITDLQRALDALQPQHERAQQEHQHVVDQAHQALLDAQAVAALADPNDPIATQRATERVHAAEAQLRQALDAQDRMRTEQGIERQQAEAGLAQAQADLDALPDQQRQALTKLDADHRAAQILALNQVERAHGQADDDRRVQDLEAQRVVATATTAATWQAHAAATAQTHQAAVTAIAQAQPTPAPSSVISRASGWIVAVTAEEKDGQLVVTLEVEP